MNLPPTEQIELTGLYTMVRGVCVVARSEHVVQIGEESPHSLLLHHAPAQSVNILKRLDGTSPLGVVLSLFQADPLLWVEILTHLRDAGLLVPAVQWSFPGMTPGPFLEPERDSLVHRHGVTTARRIVQARHDAVVVVRGSGRVATAIASSLGVAGIGHIHQQPDRALRLADLPEFVAPVRSVPPSPPDAVRRSTSTPSPAASRSDIGAPTRADSVRLAAALRRSAPTIKVHLPAAHHRVALVVLAGDGPPAPSLAAELTGESIPHLAVQAGLSRSVVGPLVLPGRSTCLVCALRQRTDLDEGRSAFEEGQRQELVVPPAQLVIMTAALAAGEALDHLDGINVPRTVDGTLEWQLGDLAPRRRSWAMHPHCGCTAAQRA